jgi:hypothetical protein
MLRLIILYKMNNLEDENIVTSDVEDTESILNYVENKVDKIKKSKNIRKTEVMTRKTKKKLIECAEKIELHESQLNDNKPNEIYNEITNIQDNTLESLFDKLNDLHNKINNVKEIEQSIIIYKNMNQLMNIIKERLDIYKMQIINI